MNHIFIALFLVYVFLCPWTRGDGTSQRIIAADFVSVSLIALGIFNALQARLTLTVHYRMFLPFLVVILISGLVARYPERAALEIIVTLFGFLGSVAMVSMATGLSERQLQNLITGYFFVVGGLAILFLIDYLLLPGLIGRTGGGLTGPMRNTGQAGAFLGMHLAIVTALLLSGLVKLSWVNLLLLAFVIMAMIFTLKRATWVGFGAGMVFLTLLMAFSKSIRDKKLAAVFAVFALILIVGGSFVFDWALENTKGMAWRFAYKFSTDAVEDFSTGFLQENINGTLSALGYNAFLGVGLGNVAGVHTDHYEIHSTYLGVLATTGLIGLCAYIAFASVLLRSVFLAGRSKAANSYASFNYYFLPLLLGLFISWAYTYHVRKREFWVIMFFVGITWVRRHIESGEESEVLSEATTDNVRTSPSAPV